MTERPPSLRSSKKFRFVERLAYVVRGPALIATAAKSRRRVNIHKARLQHIVINKIARSYRKMVVLSRKSIHPVRNTRPKIMWRK